MHKKGFTLIEMLIVIAIIGILASIVLVGLGPVQRNARDARRASDLRQIQTLLELCFAADGAYPATIDEADIQTCSGSGNVKVPLDPTSGGQYGYSQISSSEYLLGAQLENITNPLLDNSIDGGTADPLTCDVAAGVYCVGI